MAEMSADLRQEIERSADETSFPPEDALVMVTLVARNRRRMYERSSEAESYAFGGKVLCFIFDPVKSEQVEYVEAMRSIRTLYRGIHSDPKQQREFEQNLSKDFLLARSAGEAIKMGPNALFVRQLTSGGV